MGCNESNRREPSWAEICRRPCHPVVTRWTGDLWLAVVFARHTCCLCAQQMMRESDALGRKNTFLLCRYALIFATGGLAFSEVAKDSSPLPIAIIILTALASNVALSQASPLCFFDAWTQAPVLVADTALISIALLLTRASQESFFFFFFVLIMAAKVENLATLGICAAAVGLASFLMADPSGGWASPSLMRIPFMFAAAIFFGYIVLPERTGEMNGFSSSATATRKQPPPIRPRLKDAA